jgi:cytochrome c556
MRVRVYVGAMLIAWSGAVALSGTHALAQGQKITTPEQLDKVMKSVGPTMRNMQAAMKASNWADMKKELATQRQGVLDSQSFWINYKKDDAVDMNKAALAKIDALDKVLSTEPVDSAAVAAALKEVGGSCSACHKQYRTQDADNNYILKPGTIPGA